MSDAERLQAIDREIAGAIWVSDEPWKNLVYLCDVLGHRFAGSSQEHAAAEFLKQKMEAYGLAHVQLEEFPIATWERGPCTLILVEPFQRMLPAIAMPYCPSAAIEGEIVDVGEGELPDFERCRDVIPGRIVLTDAETNRPGERKSHRIDKFGWAIERGAIACLFVNQNPGQLHITGGLRGRGPRGVRADEAEAPIPGLGLSYETGMLLRRLAKQGAVRLRLETQNRTRDSVSYNVIGEIPGTTKADELILVGGHYDGHDISQGATDDAAGAVVGLEVGRVLAPLRGQLQRTVRILCFGAEELGLFGSWYHIEHHAQEHIRFMLNLDGAGRGLGGQEELRLSGWAELVPYFQQLGQQLAYPFGVRDDLNAHSDHFPFAVHGIPNGTLVSRDATAGMIGRGWGHTEADTLDKLSLRGVQLAAMLAARLVVRLSEDDAFPAQRRDLAAVRQQLADAGVLDELLASGRFPQA